jgi:GWxTD domain-containing protein
LLNLQVPWQDEQAWRQHVGWLEGFLSPENRQALGEMEAAARLKAWRGLWQEIGTASGQPPAEVEQKHLLRVVEADRRFGRVGRGATSDRGRVFIRYGEPDQVEVLEDETGRSGLWEIWYYVAERLQFTFYDPHGIGEFQLYDTSAL